LKFELKFEKLSEYLINSGKFHYEAEILRYFYPEEEVRYLTNIELYQLHFMLFHSLYTLKPVMEEKGYYLHIHFMRIGAIAYPEGNKCRYFDNVEMNFCGMSVGDIFCEKHKINYSSHSLENIDSKAYFYLDKANLDYFNDEILENWMSGMNHALKNNDYFSEALSLLGLNENFDIESLKKAYRIFSKLYHPDMNNESYERFLEINRAYQYLLKCLPVM